MGSDYQHVPDSFNSMLNNNDSDTYDQFVNGDYKSLSRASSIKTNDLELKNLNKNRANSNRVIRRLRTNSFNNNYNANNTKTNSNNTLTNNNSIIQDLNDFKSSVKKLLMGGSKQKLSPSSSINLIEKKKRKKRSFSHSFSNNYEEDISSEEDDDDVEEENEEDYQEELITKKPLINRTNSKKDQKMTVLNSKTNENIPNNLITSTATTSSTDSYMPSSSDCTSSKSAYSELLDSRYNESDKMSLDENNNQQEEDKSSLNLSENNIKQDLTEIKRVDSVRMRHNSSLNYPNSNKFDQNLVQYKKVKSRKKSQQAKNYIVIFVLFVVNLLNYIDRYTLAGVLLDLQKFFNINDGQSGLLQTAFICSYMLLAPLFGYLGDRYSRKWLIIFGISFWSFMTFIGSFVPEDKFWLFMLIRSLVGIGEASYSCVAPTIIGDLFTDDMRTKMLAVFYLAVPVGSGLGYIVGSNIAKILGGWQWALRVTPPLGLVCIVLLVLVVEEPKRGGAEGNSVDNNKSSIKLDVIYLLKNKTFMWTTMGFTFASFVLGGLSWWVPIYVEYAIYSKNKTPNQIPLIFGVITCFAGLIGVTLSSVLSSKLRHKFKNADPLICALGSLIAVPTLFVLILATREANQILFWFIAALAISGMCLSWTLVADILLYTVYPNRRSIASAMNILICHLLGDAGSPYVIGAISDALKIGSPDSYYTKFKSLQTALYAGPFFAALSFASYLFAAIYVDDDRKKVDDYIKKCQKSNERPNSSSLSDSNINELSNEIKESPNVYSKSITTSELNLNKDPSVQIKPSKENIDINNEIPVVFNSSANLLPKSIESNIDK
ncbi:unnamed protein product [Brachionus calyciflorus]|uniref:Major facilitator superfamily (MFS) profile domain-containing protein n=1 Tax=Brachionus calyciflorus TaxID=104777 RepID=A0A813QSX5_9BILA|nr:unnamed protein product [Brachionus calyciflorus]